MHLMQTKGAKRSFLYGGRKNEAFPFVCLLPATVGLEKSNIRRRKEERIREGGSGKKSRTKPETTLLFLILFRFSSIFLWGPGYKVTLELAVELNAIARGKRFEEGKKLPLLAPDSP